ncbi:MAG: pirin family protein [Isosphaeraceae bacterium]
MIRIRPADERGHADYGWLKTSYSFSFNTYHDPAHMGFRTLRVINEDVVQPGQGFGMHGHRDMEIVTYVLSGALEHRDSLGNGGILRAGEFQRMTAGTGIRHSEFNPSADEPLHLYQIWLFPERPGLTPGYEQKAVEPKGHGRFRPIATPDGRDGSLRIHQDAEIAIATLEPGTTATFPMKPGRHAWVQVVRGSLSLNGHALKASDGAAVSDESALEFAASEPAEVMLFDLA